MAETKYNELIASSEAIINLLLGDSSVNEFTEKVSRNEDYDVIDSYEFANKFKVLIDNNLITSFAIKMFKNNDVNSKSYGKEFLRYKVHSRIPTPTGTRYFESDYGVGYGAKEVFEKLKTKEIDTDHLPISWLNSLVITTKKRKSDNEVFVNADIKNVDALLK